MTTSLATTARQLAQWASRLVPTEDDLRLAQNALTDTIAVTLAAKTHPIARIASPLPAGARWSTLGHVLDFDDVHLESTTHISVVIVPAVLATGGDASAYLGGAGVMARLGTALGWGHYSLGWHATCTAGAPAAAVAAGLSLGLDVDQLATAIALAIPCAGGVQTAFGTYAKPLQVGLATQAGIQAAQLARAGATANDAALDSWIELVGGRKPTIGWEASAVPGGLAIKLFPCCYAMQRPIAAVRMIAGRLPNDLSEIGHIVVTTPQSGIKPLIHDAPDTGLEGKFSLQYAVATAILDSYPGFDSFGDEAVSRESARVLMDKIDIEVIPGGTGLLDGCTSITIVTNRGVTIQTELAVPPGAPTRPPTATELLEKAGACGIAELPPLTWASAVELLDTTFPQARTTVS
ncbi:MmgE/PrpD family protein [Gordonia sp. TBRC 11910]|uniref:MmgE/PrpD family protein n=2 Tax=Gordonia asplenii TaxID=2725283 RepID=A0A848KZK2_9ACTN|nr:MmgE/PrpD family protein [Gordonia asplenii]